MKRLIISALVSFFFLSGLTGCNTMGAIKEDFNNITGNSSSEPSKSVVVPSDRRQLVQEVQTMLTDKGYDPGPVDGQAGPSTMSALRAFQAARGLTVTDGVTREAYIQLASDNASGSTTQSSQEDQRECVRNFTKQSGMRNYRTTVTINGVSQQLATKRLVRALGRKGFVIHENDEARGNVNATFDAGGSGIQLSAFIEQSSVGCTAELNYVGTGAGLGVLFVPGSAYRNELCEYVEAMQTGS
jgi:peptidoglycan hydrolase-like protein with peptidoglycan-binding domain